jgi:hypothetical protein
MIRLENYFSILHEQNFLLVIFNYKFNIDCLLFFFCSFSTRGNFFSQGPMSRRKSSFHPRFNMVGPDIIGIQ